MAVRVFDFLCPVGHRIERFVNDDIHEVECHCGAMGRRQIAAPRAKLEPFSGAFPSAADKWVRDRESHMAREEHNLDNHGSYK